MLRIVLLLLLLLLLQAIRLDPKASLQLASQCVMLLIVLLLLLPLLLLLLLLLQAIRLDPKAPLPHLGTAQVYLATGGDPTNSVSELELVLNALPGAAFCCSPGWC
jgi:hypothetical protein